MIDYDRVRCRRAEWLRGIRGHGDRLLHAVDSQPDVDEAHCLLSEIGKIGIWTAEQFAAARPNGSYFPFDLGEQEQQQAMEQWLRRIPNDPGGLLRRKFRYQYQKTGKDQDGNNTWPDDEVQPW